MNALRRVLLIDDEPMLRDELAGLLTDEGFSVVTARDGEEGLARFRSEAPDMVITDVRMPRRDGLSVAMTIRREAPKTPVTVVTGHGNETMVLDALRAGVTDFIKKPVRFEDLTMALDRMEASLRLARREVAELPRSIRVLERTWAYQMDNDLTAIPLFVDVLMRRAEGGGDTGGGAELSLAIREMLTNAIEHGSLELTYEEKSRALDRGNLTAVIAERREHPVLAQRDVTVWVKRQGAALTVRICDEGSGFDWRDLPDPSDPSYLLADHGRGVLLARLSVDSLQYNEAGNEVTLMKCLEAEK